GWLWGSLDSSKRWHSNPAGGAEWRTCAARGRRHAEPVALSARQRSRCVTTQLPPRNSNHTSWLASASAVTVWLRSDVAAVRAEHRRAARGSYRRGQHRTACNGTDTVIAASALLSRGELVSGERGGVAAAAGNRWRGRRAGRAGGRRMAFDPGTAVPIGRAQAASGD